LISAWIIRFTEVIHFEMVESPTTKSAEAWVKRLIQAIRLIITDPLYLSQFSASNQARAKIPLQNLTEISLWQVVCYLGLLPILVYCLIWIPHLPLNEGLSFIQRHQEMLRGHILVEPDGHPNCARWYTWPLMLIPTTVLWRHYNKDTPEETVYIVQNYGNPILAWLSTLAVILVVGMLVWRLRVWLMSKVNHELPHLIPAPQSPVFWTLLYISVSYAANLLPWTRVTRCTFLYHYASSYAFAILAIAWMIDRLLRSQDLFLRVVAGFITFIILCAFVFWLPLWLALPLSASEYEARLWLPIWDRGWTYLINR
jgi:dolichyl-phosphate-mannose-protein mannosyltransferase